jgi:hypothetical protein
MADEALDHRAAAHRHLGVIGEVISPERQKYFMPGGDNPDTQCPIRRRTFVADDCESCHLPWRSVSSSKCIDCHPQHRTGSNGVRPINQTRLLRLPRRTSRRDELGAIPDTSCVACHSTQRVSISGFGAPKHPDFVYPRDANTLRFNHKFHLAPKGVLKKGRRTVLQCANCHDLTGAQDPKPVTYARHCHDCHNLKFLPDEEVPHGGDNRMVYGYIAARSRVSARLSASLRRKCGASRDAGR